MKRSELRQALKEARTHVYRQQHHGKHEQDRADAVAWMSKWGRMALADEHDPCSCVKCTKARLEALKGGQDAAV